MPALGKMSQDDVNAALSALVEPAIMGLKKQSFRGASRSVPELNYTAATSVIAAAQGAVDLNIFEIESRPLQIDPTSAKTTLCILLLMFWSKRGQGKPPATRLKGSSLLNILIRGPR